MKALELYQLLSGLSFTAVEMGKTYTAAGGGPEPKVTKYIQELTSLLAFINSKKDSKEPFGPNELDELTEHISTFRVAIRELKNRVPDVGVERAEYAISQLEQVAALMDVTVGKSLSETIDNTTVVSVDTKVIPAQAQDYSSVRHKINISTGLGNGFFTPEHKLFDEKIAKDIDYEFRKAIVNNPNDKDIKNFYDRLKRSPYGMHTLFDCMNPNYVLETRKNPRLGHLYSTGALHHYKFLGYFETVDEFEIHREGISDILIRIRNHYDDEFREMCNDCRQYGKWDGTSVKAIEGSSKPGRNVAVSNMANLLGVPSIVAKAVPVTLRVGDGENKGVFMKEAEGTFAPARPYLHKTDLMLCDKESFDGNILKQLAELQVLDYICQNVDRYSNNIIYKIGEDGKVTGIQGIDNDYSFGTVKTKDSLTFHHGSALNDITVISVSMANKIKSLQPETFAASLAGLGLKKEEIQSAWERLVAFRQHLERNTTADAIAPGKIKVLKDDEWQNLKLEDLSNARQYANSRKRVLHDMGNIFSRVKALVSVYVEEKLKYFKGNSEKYLTSKDQRFRNIQEEEIDRDIYGPDRNNVDAPYTFTAAYNAASFDNIEKYRSHLHFLQTKMDAADDEVKEDENFKAIGALITTTKGLDLRLLKDTSSEKTQAATETKYAEQQKLRWEYRSHLLGIINLTKNFLDKYADRVNDPSISYNYENIRMIHDVAVVHEEIFHEADMRIQEETLDAVHLELIAEQQQFENIVQTLVDTIAKKMEGVEGVTSEAIRASIENGPALKAMMDDDDLYKTVGEKDYLEYYSKLATEDKDELVRLYTEHLKNADRNIIIDNIGQHLINHADEWKKVLPTVDDKKSRENANQKEEIIQNSDFKKAHAKINNNDNDKVENKPSEVEPPKPTI